MSQYAAHQAYKPTGIERLVELPKHWNVASLRRLLTEPLANGLFKKREHWGSGTKIVNVFDAYVDGDVVDEQSLDRVACDESELRKYSVKHGDFVFVRSSLKLEGIGKSASVLKPSESIVFECHLVRGCPDTNTIEPTFLCYFLNSSYSRQSLVALSNQVTMATIDQEKFKSLSIAIPPIPEQQVIARFLDFKTAQIDALIAKKKALLDKLAEKRTALINHAVTKGLDPSVPMKDSGVAWLGNVPKHWHIMRIKNVATHNDESLDDGTEPDFEIEYVDISSVSLINGVEQSELMTFEKSPSRARRKVKDGDIIVSTVRTYLKAIAAISNPPDNMIVSTGFAVIRPKENFHSSFAGYLLQTTGFVGEVVAYSVGVSYPAINASDLVRIAAVVPPLDEQIAIAQFLDKQVVQLNSQRQKIEDVISKLQEYRSALITNAVTGKIDVRGIEIPQPTEEVAS
ncbi:restriction endonuclease subunit S [Aeromonas veronii]|uniref:restriction endonuclease subunit S n=1 Tax=Aeromonas veronii TaxID=654 RepID=UPI00191F4BAF|nr:restriction endonuclease subunit S [Aeromonas veronii]MBL0445997.1 restriction endonuclease subunit S [Aeromonas veronii]